MNETALYPPRTLEPAALARITAGVIWRHPRRHEQAVWLDGPFTEQPAAAIAATLGTGSCKTTGCVAGWTAVLGAGPGTVIRADDDMDGDWAVVIFPGAAATNLPDYATYLLGLTLEQAGWLFHGDRTRWEILAGLLLLATRPAAAVSDLDAAPRPSPAVLDALPCPPAAAAA